MPYNTSVIHKMCKGRGQWAGNFIWCYLVAEFRTILEHLVNWYCNYRKNCCCRFDGICQLVVFVLFCFFSWWWWSCKTVLQSEYIVPSQHNIWYWLHWLPIWPMSWACQRAYLNKPHDYSALYTTHLPGLFYTGSTLYCRVAKCTVLDDYKNHFMISFHINNLYMRY